ncbi:Facilitated trehalose transporter Tret1 [Nymphon striatum]|nr:Facilitated trehalose transporter Tret1 [Nymphon striatum]
MQIIHLKQGPVEAEAKRGGSVVNISVLGLNDPELFIMVILVHLQVSCLYHQNEQWGTLELKIQMAQCSHSGHFAKSWTEKNSNVSLATSFDENDAKKSTSTQGGLTFKLILAVFASWMGSVAMGTVIGFSSPSIPMMENNDEPLRITSEQADWFGSLLSLGALIGGPIGDLEDEELATAMKDQVQWRKIVKGVRNWQKNHSCLRISAIYAWKYFDCICQSRLNACSLGDFSQDFLLVWYLSQFLFILPELSPPANRGQLSTVIQLSVTAGLVYTFSFGYFIFWTWLAIACTAFPLIMATILIFMPETPFWLMKYNKTGEAMASLIFIRGKDADIKHEFQELSVAVQKQNAIGSFSLSMLKDPTVYKPLIVSLFIMGFQQLCGINAVMFYTVSIFKNAGSSIDPKICTIIVGVTQFVGTFGASFITDKVGRRLLLLISGVGMCVSLGIFGVYYYLVKLKGTQFEDDYGWLPLVCLIVYNLFFAIGYGPIPWVLLGELFPLRAKGFASGLSTGFNWFVAFLVTQEFSNMLESIHAFGTYFFFAATCFVGCIFVYVFLIETKGRSFEEIEEQYKPKSGNIIVEEIRL